MEPSHFTDEGKMTCLLSSKNLSKNSSLALTWLHCTYAFYYETEPLPNNRLVIFPLLAFLLQTYLGCHCTLNTLQLL
jgi:hypothetical protein